MYIAHLLSSLINCFAHLLFVAKFLKIGFVGLLEIAEQNDQLHN